MAWSAALGHYLADLAGMSAAGALPRAPLPIVQSLNVLRYAA